MQDPVLKTWKGDAANVEKAQKIFYHRAKLNGAARFGKYTKDMEKVAA
ncbi:MAG: class I fructose-bisphosphate aldolase [Candidatus Binatia bacterium]